MTQETFSIGRRTITAFFDHMKDAENAIERLAQAGVPRRSISLVPGAGGEQATHASESMGFWEALKDMFFPDEDRAIYAEGLRRGGYMVTVQTDSAHYDTAIGIMDDEGTVNLDERAESWRKEGWTGSAQFPGRSTGTAHAGTGKEEEVIPVTEEQLRVGKREVSHGRVRVRTYVVETPMEENVNLRDEHVRVERRPVDRAVTGNERPFQDRVIEAEERAEEAVVSKEARVKEELVVKKDVEQRTETVSDTVRRTEVDVKDERGGAAKPGARKPS
jgi:uncharacterized protein (TIGR02271 family)